MCAQVGCGTGASVLAIFSSKIFLIFSAWLSFTNLMWLRYDSLPPITNRFSIAEQKCRTHTSKIFDKNVYTICHPFCFGILSLVSKVLYNIIHSFFMLCKFVLDNVYHFPDFSFVWSIKRGTLNIHKTVFLVLE